MNAGHNVLMMANTGVGKSVCISSFLNEMVALGKTKHLRPNPPTQYVPS